MNPTSRVRCNMRTKINRVRGVKKEQGFCCELGCGGKKSKVLFGNVETRANDAASTAARLLHKRQELVVVL
jgi:hypothetical protein